MFPLCYKQNLVHMDLLFFWVRGRIFATFSQKVYDSKSAVNILEISAESGAEARRALKFLKFFY